MSQQLINCSAPRSETPFMAPLHDVQPRGRELDLGRSWASGGRPSACRLTWASQQVCVCIRVVILVNCCVDENQKMCRDQVQHSSEVQIQIRAHVSQLQGQVIALMHALSKINFTGCSVNKKIPQTKNSGAAVLHTPLSRSHFSNL